MAASAAAAAAAAAAGRSVGRSVGRWRRPVATTTLRPAGYVRTRMTNGNGLIDAHESASGMLAVLEGSLPLNGRWYDFAGREIPW